MRNLQNEPSTPPPIKHDEPELASGLEDQMQHYWETMVVEGSLAQPAKRSLYQRIVSKIGISSGLPAE